MSGRLILNQIEGKSGASNIVTVPTGHRVVGVDTGSVYAPGCVVQFKYYEYTGTTVKSTATWEDLFSYNFTPKFSNSLVHVRVKIPTFIYGSAQAIGGGYRLYRDSTIIDDSQGDGSGPVDFWLNLTAMPETGYRDLFLPIVKEAIDMPNTTSQVTYKIQWYSRAQNMRTNYNRSEFNPKTLMTIMEIAQ